MTITEQRKRNIVGLRGLLLFTFAAYFYYLHRADPTHPSTPSFIFFGLYLTTWVVSVTMPIKYYGTLMSLYLVFILDIAFIVAGIYIARVAGLNFYVTIFLLIFASAIARSLRLSVLIAMIGCFSYFFLVANMPLSATIFEGSEYLALPFLFLVSIFSGYIVTESDREQRHQEAEKKKILDIFSKYVSSSIIDEAMSAGRVKLGGEKQQLSVLFCDIVNFTSISETLPSDELVTMLDEYFDEMIKIITKYGGTVDKLLGDAVMAIFGAPTHYPDHSLRAVATGLAIRQKAEVLKKQWTQNGWKGMDICVGINSGEAVVGNIGSDESLAYTAIGNVVNGCMRLEAINRVYKVNNIISEDTYEQVKNKITVRELDFIRIEGHSKPIKIFEVIGGAKVGKATAGILDVFHRGLSFYRQQEWDQARKSFEDILRINIDDGPSQVLRSRCLLLEKAPPGQYWDGVYTQR